MEFINAFILTMTGQNIEKGFIKVNGSKIEAVGSMQDYTPGTAAVFDVNGMTVLPGFIDAHSHIGILEDGLGFEGDDCNEDTDPTTPQLRALDAINHLDYSFKEAIDAGVTTAAVSPGSANPISGQICVVKTSGACVDEMLLREPAAIKMAFGENPKFVYHSKTQTPVTRMATAAIIREQLFKAKRYMEDKQRAEEDEELDLPEYNEKAEALIPLLQGEIEAHIHAHRADDIITAIRISKEFGLKSVLVHATEGHLIAGQIKKAEFPAIVGPIIISRSKPEMKNHTVANAAALNEAGVKIAIGTDHPELPVQYLALSGALCVSEGLPLMRGLEAITKDAAEICGISDRVGTIEVGKDADLIVFRSNPLEVGSKPEIVVVNGVRVK